MLFILVAQNRLAVEGCPRRCHARPHGLNPTLFLGVPRRHADLFEILSQDCLKTPNFVVFFAPDPKQTYGAGLIGIGLVSPDLDCAITSKPGGDQPCKASVDVNFIADTEMDVVMTPTDRSFPKRQQW